MGRHSMWRPFCGYLMSDEIYRFEDHRRRQSQDSVRCARCGKMILATVTRCPECGVHFQGEAYDFAPESGSTLGGRLRGWGLLVVVILVLAALLIGSIGLR
jgi:ribosomal protein L37AE/L43A